MSLCNEKQNYTLDIWVEIRKFQYKKVWDLIHLTNFFLTFRGNSSFHSTIA